MFIVKNYTVLSNIFILFILPTCRKIFHKKQRLGKYIGQTTKTNLEELFLY
jgi:hypothetical protein